MLHPPHPKRSPAHTLLYRKMKMKFLAWLLIILCARILSSLAHENSSTDKGLDISTRPMREQDIHAVNGTIALHGDRNDRENELKHGMVNSRKAQRGKGGASIVHRPEPSKTSAVSLLKRPSFLISTLISCVSFASLLALF